MTTLIFSATDLRPIVEWTLNHREHTPTFSQMTEPQYLKPGETIPKNGFAEGEQMDLSKIPPAIHFVKDDGIYLLSSAANRDLVSVGGRERSRVAYAKGFDPDKDEDCWEACREAVGGDDFVEALPIEWFKPVLEDAGIAAVRLIVSANDIRAAYTRKR